MSPRRKSTSTSLTVSPTIGTRKVGFLILVYYLKLVFDTHPVDGSTVGARDVHDIFTIGVTDRNDALAGVAQLKSNGLVIDDRDSSQMTFIPPSRILQIIVTPNPE